MSTSILLVEDDEPLGRQIVTHLERAGHAVQWSRDGAEAILLDPQRFALLVLDLMLPGAHGLTVLERWRQRTDRPVLVLSAISGTDTKVRALKMGADDYLTKPFWPEELLARVQARLRRPTLHETDVVEVGPLRLELDSRKARIDGQELDLTRVEFDLLAALARRAGSALSRKWLVENVLDPRREGTARTLDVHVFRLRKKLGVHGSRLATVWNVGYRLQEPDRS